MTSTDRSPFTTVTWAQIGILSASNKPQWMAEADLVAEALPRLPHLTEQHVRSLVSSTGTLTPIVITWDQPAAEDHDGEPRVERTTDACVIEHMTVPRDLPGGTLDVRHLGYVTLHRVGFKSDVYLKDIRDVCSFGAVREYVRCDQA